MSSKQSSGIPETIVFLAAATTLAMIGVRVIGNYLNTNLFSRDISCLNNQPKILHLQEGFDLSVQNCSSFDDEKLKAMIQDSFGTANQAINIGPTKIQCEDQIYDVVPTMVKANDPSMLVVDEGLLKDETMQSYMDENKFVDVGSAGMTLGSNVTIVNGRMVSLEQTFTTQHRALEQTLLVELGHIMDSSPVISKNGEPVEDLFEWSNLMDRFHNLAVGSNGTVGIWDVNMNCDIVK